MSSPKDWRAVYDFWFPIDLSQAEIGEHWRMLLWWMRGGANAELGPFASLVGEATAGRLDHWLETPRGRLSLILVLDQFPRGLFAGSPEAYRPPGSILNPDAGKTRQRDYEPWQPGPFK